MPKTTGRKPSDDVKWESCFCGCWGKETIYKGHYFWTGYSGFKWYLFTTHTGFMGFHVAEHEYKTLAAASEAVKKHYRDYPKVKPINWHKCPCKGKRKHFTATFRHLRFAGHWDGFKRRFVLYQGHSPKRVRGLYRKSELDIAVRKIARSPRGEKKTA